jgi:hypothetical protein
MREDALRALAPPILASVGREDTRSPIFHGCCDWHSAVHGVYSLYAIHERTGEELYLDAAAQHVRRELVEAELAYVRDVVADEETPYGLAWLLALVAKQERVTGTRELRPLADFAAARLVSFVGGLDAGTALAAARSDAYGNLSWGLLHLARWARHADDPGLLALAQEATRRWLQDERVDAASSVADDAGAAAEFLPPALERLAAIGEVLERGEARRYVRARLPAGFRVPPLTDPETVHAGGVNAFRALALWSVCRATGVARLRENVAELVLYQLARPDLWRDCDYMLRHWVAQILVRTIDETYEP